jgi:hypothetical protein
MKKIETMEQEWTYCDDCKLPIHNHSNNITCSLCKNDTCFKCSTHIYSKFPLTKEENRNHPSYSYLLCKKCLDKNSELVDLIKEYEDKYQIIRDKYFKLINEEVHQLEEDHIKKADKIINVN